MDNHQVESPESSVTTRRRLLSALVAGGALASAAPLLAGRASAAGDGTNAPPRDTRDNNALNNALAREARMVGTYRLAVAAAAAADDEVAGLTLILDHHIAYVQAIKGYLGPDAKAAPETPLSNPSGSVKSMAASLAQLEDETATIHTDILAILSGMDGAKIIASIVIVEARHAAALSVFSGLTPLAASGN